MAKKDDKKDEGSSNSDDSMVDEFLASEKTNQNTASGE
jgi:hypothetical protein